jgi:hypothetical protein
VNIPQYWSLLEMIEHFALRFAGAYHDFRAQMEVLLPIEREDRTKPYNERVLSDGRKEFIAMVAIHPMLQELDHLDFPVELRNKAKRLFARLALKNSRSWTAESLLDSLTDLNGDIHRELAKHNFFQVRVGGEQYLESGNLFGNDVFENFKSARKNIKDAGNCFALGLYTACVFHLMRVAEHGLRALAYDRRIKVPRGPIELATWDDIIKELEKVESAIQGYPKTLAREAQFEFYHGAMMEFKRFKNLFRNRVMHAREDYDAHDAKGAFDHVKEFMVILAGKISENKRTPLIWKRPR